MAVTLAQVIQLLGGFQLVSPFAMGMAKNPVLAAKRVVARNNVFPLGLAGMLPGLMQGGIGSILSNPMGAITSAFNGAITGAVGQITGALGETAASLTSSLSGTLTGSLGSLARMTDLLSGVSIPAVGELGFMDLVNHVGLADALGDALPVHLGLDRVLGPMNFGIAIEGMISDLGTMTPGVIAGLVPLADAELQIAQMAAEIDNVVFDATAALTGIQNFAVKTAHVSSVVSAVIHGGDLGTYAERLVSPALAAQVKAQADAVFGSAL